mmetsp:Transcript_12345/g.18969  ORF Transcript_12345/g.18969 Transcript_12345/m.18969 type:complete len:205 (-) Transcript_12345:419-1033(-)
MRIRHLSHFSKHDSLKQIKGTIIHKGIQIIFVMVGTLRGQLGRFDNGGNISPGRLWGQQISLQKSTNRAPRFALSKKTIVFTSSQFQVALLAPFDKGFQIGHTTAGIGSLISYDLEHFFGIVDTMDQAHARNVDGIKITILFVQGGIKIVNFFGVHFWNLVMFLQEGTNTGNDEKETAHNWKGWNHSQFWMFATCTDFLLLFLR